MAETEHHPTLELDRVLSGKASDSERRRAVDHLLQGCSVCSRRTLDSIRPGGRQAPSDEELGSVLRRAVRGFKRLEAQVEEEGEEAKRLLAMLERHPHGRAVTVLSSSRRYQRRGVCEQLLSKAIASRRNDPSGSFHYAEQALAVAERYDEPGFEELRARAWMEVANAHRILGDLRKAECAFEEAERWLERDGGADPTVEAELLLLIAALRQRQRKVDDAIALNNRAIDLYESVHDVNGIARGRVQIANVHAVMGDLESAIQWTWMALQGLGTGVPLPSLFLPIYNLLHWLVQAGHHRLAIDLMGVARPIFEACAGELDLAHFHWGRAQLETQLGRLDEAAWALEGLRDQFVGLGLPFDVALASLDLAFVYARQGRTSELRALASELLPIFRGLGIARETLATLALLRRAEADQASTAGLIRGLAEAVAAQRGERAQSLPPLP
jgi:tetratricopeptide (TPR) repeat protein